MRKFSHFFVGMGGVALVLTVQAQESRPPLQLDEALRMDIPFEGTTYLPAFARMAAGGGFSVSNLERNAVAGFYYEVYLDSEGVADEWTGEVASCNEGTVSTNYLAASLRRINYYRAMCGLPANLKLSNEWNEACQKAALMMSRNAALSHYPPTSWSCFTTDGSNAASHANLALGSQGPDAMDGFMEDYGAGNSAVGHRRWFLYPPLQTIGIGTLPGEGSYYEAAVVWVIGGNGTRPGYPPFVSWPNSGYCPASLAPERWSFSINGANFSAATVTVSCAGAPLGVVKEAVANGYGDNTLVWKVNGFPIGPVASDSNYIVCVSNVLGTATSVYTYSVTLINQAALLDVMSISGDSEPCVSNLNVYTFTPVPYATAYVVRVGQIIPGDWFEGAETGTNGVVTHVPSDYCFRTNSLKASGSYSFHIAADWGEQYFDVDRVIRPETNSVLLFKTCMRYATVYQSASALVSADDGATWDTMWSTQGSGGLVDTVFKSHAIELGGYTGCNLRVRFLHYSDSGGSAYLGSNTSYGIFVDDIQATNSLELVPYSTFSVTTNAFEFEPETPDLFVLQIAPMIGGHVFPYGEASIVHARAQPCNVTPAFSSVTWSPADFRLSFIGESGRTYRVYGTDRITNSTWSDLIAVIESEGSFLSVTDSPPSAPLRFYRIIRE